VAPLSADTPVVRIASSGVARSNEHHDQGQETAGEQERELARCNLENDNAAALLKGIAQDFAGEVRRKVMEGPKNGAYFADSDHAFRPKSIRRFAPCRSPGSDDVDQG
jgi:hypothetical protein